jgi:hypothetical protein
VIQEVAVQAAVAIAVLLAPLPFLAAVAVAAIVRSRRGSVGPLLGAIVAFTGGLAVGTFLLMAGDQLLLMLPVAAMPVFVAVNRWRARRRAQAGWLIAGTALPWTILWGSYAVRLVGGVTPVEPAITLGAFALGALPLLGAIVVALAGDPPPPPPAMDAPAGQPGSRAAGSIAAAIREPALIGPFGQPELALSIAIVVVLLVVPFAIPRDAWAIVRVGLLALVSAVVGAEVYVRAWPARSRRAFEAFSWLGEWELARARRAIGRWIPSSPPDAEHWLEAYPTGPIRMPEELPVRIEILLLAERIDDGRRLLEDLPTDTPWARFEVAALRDLVDWRAGGDGDLPAMETAAREIEPADGDDRLRADVTIATATVRRRMADGTGTASDRIQPFLEVRERLGRRADGQLGRALRWRITRTLLVLGVVAGVIFELAAQT